MAPPTFLLPLNFHFTSVLCLGLLNVNAFHGNQISGGPISEQREWLRTMTSRLRASFSCSQRKTMEKATREAIRSAVGSLPKIDQYMVNHNDRKQRTVRVIEQQLNQNRSTELGHLGCQVETTFVSLRLLSAADPSFSSKK